MQRFFIAFENEFILFEPKIKFNNKNKLYRSINLTVLFLGEKSQK